MRRDPGPFVRNRAMFFAGLALATWWVLVLATPAEAYIDPSAGGMLVQLLLAGTAGVAVLAKLFWVKIKGLFGVAEPDRPANTKDDVPPHDGV